MDGAAIAWRVPPRLEVGIAASVTEHCRNSLVQFQRPRFVEKHLAPASQNLFDDFVDRIVQSRVPTAVGMQSIAVCAEVGGMVEADFNQERLTTLLESGPPHLIDARGVPVGPAHRLFKAD